MPGTFKTEGVVLRSIRFGEADRILHLYTVEKGRVNAIAKGSRGGREYAFPRGNVIVHVTTHGMHHRAQCVNMLRHIGINPLPQSSVLEWMIAQQYG